MHSMKDDWAEMGPGNCPSDLNWRSDRPMPAFPEQTLNTQILDHVKRFYKQLEDLILEAFSVRGFPKDWIQRNSKRVSVRCIRDTSTVEEAVYSVDNCDLFKVKITKTYDDDHFYIDYDVRITSFKTRNKENENA